MLSPNWTMHWGVAIGFCAPNAAGPAKRGMASANVDNEAANLPVKIGVGLRKRQLPIISLHFHLFHFFHPQLKGCRQFPCSEILK